MEEEEAEDNVGGRPAKGVGRGIEDGGPKGRGMGGSTSKPVGGRGNLSLSHPPLILQVTTYLKK